MKTPILLIIFNRPDTTARVFAEIRAAKPKQLFIAADGPRSEAEQELCSTTRSIVDRVDWECEVKTLFRDKNLGLGFGVDSAITWFFENVEQGIILEDDCLPSPSFFEFCEAMLEKYKNNENVGIISGDNFIQEDILEEINPNKDEYYFIRPLYLWGWATWRRAWDKHDLEMRNWPAFQRDHYLERAFKSRNVSRLYNDLFEFLYSKGTRVWDIPWFFSCLTNNMLCLVPPRNLVSNIGIIGTHSTEESTLNNIKIVPISIETLQHPEEVAVNIEVEDLFLKYTFVDRFSYRILLIKILKVLKIRDLARSIYRKFNLKF